ncbi:hypothetical protein L2748_22955 [Shewanella sairae]|uniref:hypothetical protein n=1 Tax=Shewanella sairae TaxID=190310 RepID=UPI00200DAD15|nr:hypothetical protein [Shewanella sairae]MCL1132534.1 hypothetical protein [Shewanella sairae]
MNSLPLSDRYISATYLEFNVIPASTRALIEPHIHDLILSTKGVSSLSYSGFNYTVRMKEDATNESIIEAKNTIQSIAAVFDHRYDRGEAQISTIEKQHPRTAHVHEITSKILFWTAMLVFYFVWIALLTSIVPILYIFDYFSIYYPLIVIFPVVMLFAYKALSHLKLNIFRRRIIKFIPAYLCASAISFWFATQITKEHIENIALNKYQTPLSTFNINLETYSQFGGYFSEHATIIHNGERKHWSFKANDFISSAN